MSAWRKSYEHDAVHPVVAEWLTEHEYTYQHEFRLPSGKKPDFVATHKDGHVLVIECKSNGDSLFRTVTQVLYYREELGGLARAAIALPKFSIERRDIEFCERLGAQVIEVAVSSTTKVSTDIPDEWVKALKQAALDAGAQSVRDYLRMLVQKAVGQ